MSDLYVSITRNQWPIIYRKEYNVNFWGLEKLHPFDSKKWKHIFKYLVKSGLIQEESILCPNEAKENHLLQVHSTRYLRNLKCSCYVASIAEVIPLIFVPNFLVQKSYLRPMRYQTGGSILAGEIALIKGWAINLGGGFHHCSATKGGGFCPYADITLLVEFLLKRHPEEVKRIMIIDLDAHQGNGYQRDFKRKKNIYIFDAYNKWIYPNDASAKSSINKQIELDYFTGDLTYLSKIDEKLTESLREFTPDLIVYNAGTDVLVGDPLGGLSITPQGVIKRDEIVFKKARSLHIPIVMLTSGGYLKESAKVIADSILNLHNVGLIDGPRPAY